MEILFIVDSIDDIERKISLLDVFGADIKFFVNSKYVADIVKNKFIVNRAVAIYKHNVNTTLDKYLKATTYKPTSTILYYSSAELTTEIIDKIRDNIQFNPHTIYIKKKFNWWSKIKLWFYKKIIKLIFGVNDEFASIKLQYFSAELMDAFVQTNFKNHIFTVPGAVTIELNNGKDKTYYNKPKFNKNYLYNPIILCLILICYVLLEKFAVLGIFIYNWIIIDSYDKLDSYDSKKSF